MDNIETPIVEAPTETTVDTVVENPIATFDTPVVE